MNVYEYINKISPFSLAELETKTSYPGRIHYCKSRLETLAHGSARVVFVLGENVIKVAKNEKGFEQNLIESIISESNTHNVATLVKSGNGIYNVFKKAATIDLPMFEQFTNIKMCDLHTYLKYEKDKKKYNIKHDYYKEKIINENEFVGTLCGLIRDYDLSVGDLIRISSWGIYENEAVLIDFGLTSTIYKKYYKG